MSNPYKAAQAAKLALANEWLDVLTTLGVDAYETAHVVTDVKLSGKYAEMHPFYAGKLSLLRYLIDIAKGDVKRYSELESDQSA